MEINLLIYLHITPKSAKNQIIGWVKEGDNWVLKVKVAAPPEDGKANVELIKFLSKYWKVSKSALELVSGETSRHKRLKVHDVVLADILEKEKSSL